MTSYYNGFDRRGLENQSIQAGVTEPSFIQQVKKTFTRSNWNYLHKHPEIRALIRVFLKAVFQAEPKDIYRYGVKFFQSRRMVSIINEVNKELEKMRLQCNLNETDNCDKDFGDLEKLIFNAKSKKCSCRDDILNFIYEASEEASEESTDLHYTNVNEINCE